MARRREQMWMPGVPRSPFPDGWTQAPIRRRPRRIATTRSAPRMRTEVREVATAIGISISVETSAMRATVTAPGREPEERKVHEITPGVYEVRLTRADTSLQPAPVRPVTYDHPLALAARAGRKHALWRGPEPTFATAEECRAFEVARARRVAWRRGER